MCGLVLVKVRRKSETVVLRISTNCSRDGINEVTGYIRIRAINGGT